MFVQTVKNSPKAARGPLTTDNLRSLVQSSDWTTDRNKADGIYSRYVKNDATNMRRLQEDEYIGVLNGEGEPFEAEGIVTINEAVKPQIVQGLLSTAFANYGVGSCRKMGFGLGVLVEFK